MTKVTFVLGIKRIDAPSVLNIHQFQMSTAALLIKLYPTMKARTERYDSPQTTQILQSTTSGSAKHPRLPS